MRPARFRRRGAALYLTTVSVSIVIAAMAWTMIATQRADRRLQGNIDIENQAWWAARGGIDIGLAYAGQISAWRAQGTTVLANVEIGNAKCKIEMLDDLDGDLANSECDPARLRVTATTNGSSKKLQIALLPRPHPALSYTIVGTSNQDMEFRDNARIRGPVRAHGDIKSSGNPAPQGDASFETLSGYSIDGNLTPARYTSTSISAPAVNASWYLARATAITGTTGSTCEIKGYNLTPSSNPVGSPNANGIYSLDPGGRNVVIENLHLKGTLIIHNAAGRSILFRKGLWIEPGPLNHPVLLIDNPGGSMALSPDLAQLTEVSSGLVLMVLNVPVVVGSGVDFNEDGDIADAFPTSVRGIVWSSGSSLTLNGGSWSFLGTAVNSRIIVENSVLVRNDIQLQSSLCPGFVGTGLRRVPWSLKESP